MATYKHKHSILFGDGTLQNGKFKGYDTYDDWHLIPASRPTIGMPGVETKFVAIPGRDGSIDLSDFLTGNRPAFGDRSGTFEFYVENDYDPDSRPEEFWMTIYPKIVNQIHGKKIKMVFPEDDPDYYWEGRVTVDKYEPGDGTHSNVSISYAFGPYKRKIRKISEGMVWDNFNFEKDYDHDPLHLESIQVTGNISKTIWGDGYPFPITLSCLSGPVSARFNESEVLVQSGETVQMGHAEYGLNTIYLSSDNAVVSIDWRGGSL